MTDINNKDNIDNETQEVTKLYRYDTRRYGTLDPDTDICTSSNTKLELQEFTINRYTPGGYWVLNGYRWISKHGKKRYAYPTKKEALTSFKARKNRQIQLLTAQLEEAKAGLADANKIVE